MLQRAGKIDFKDLVIEKLEGKEDSLVEWATVKLVDFAPEPHVWDKKSFLNEIRKKPISKKASKRWRTFSHQTDAYLDI